MSKTIDLGDAEAALELMQFAYFKKACNHSHPELKLLFTVLSFVSNVNWHASVDSGEG